MCDSKARSKVNLKAVNLSSFIFSFYWSKKGCAIKKRGKNLTNNVNQYFWFIVTTVGSMKNNKCNTNITQGVSWNFNQAAAAGGNFCK